jgi:hypothetical protein
MPEDVIAYSHSRHPAPYRERVGWFAIFYGLFAAPVFWSGDLMTEFALASHACYPGIVPLAHAEPGFGWVWPTVLGFHILALVLIASGFVVSLRNWRLTGPPEGHAHHLMEVGEGRTRFIGLVGMAFSMMFFVITATETIAMAWVPLCTR